MSDLIDGPKFSLDTSSLEIAAGGMEGTGAVGNG